MIIHCSVKWLLQNIKTHPRRRSNLDHYLASHEYRYNIRHWIDSAALDLYWYIALKSGTPVLRLNLRQWLIVISNSGW